VSRLARIAIALAIGLVPIRALVHPSGFTSGHISDQSDGGRGMVVSDRRCFGSTPRRIKLIRLRWSSMPRAPLAYPWEWFEATTSVECPMCGLGSRRLRPSRRRTLVCRGCGTRYNSFTCHIEQEGRPPVVLRSIQVVLNELLDAAGRHEARPSDWQEAQGALAILLERADEALPACRSLQYADPSRLVADPGLVGTAQAEIGLEIARFEQVWGSR
jgi:hypothetical protein